MLELTGYGVKNLRGLRDTGIIDLKPITILVGKNSAGKSTFARVLPLLKQSAEQRKQAPLLWFGRLVDLGSFKEAVSSFSEMKEIELHLRFSGPTAINSIRRFGRNFAVGLPGSAVIDVTMVLGVDDEDRTLLKKLKIKAYGVTAEFITEPKRSVKLLIDGSELPMPNGRSLRLIQGALIPQIRFLQIDQPSFSGTDASYFENSAPLGLGVKQARDEISNFVHGNTNSEKKDEISERLPISDLVNFWTYCANLQVATDTWRTNFNSSTGKLAPKYIALHKAIWLTKLEGLLQELDDACSSFCQKISYLEPLRATAQRFYRREEISIDELDPKGLNTTFFLQGLTLRERDNLNVWLQASLGFSLSVKSSGGHVSLNIDTGSGSFRNMADVGLGYSQIAPVAIQIWASQRRLSTSRPGLIRSRLASAQNKNSSSVSTVVIEQPELHLHPAYQAKIADIFAASVKSTSALFEVANKVRVVAETHSPNLINRLGELIGLKKIATDDVQILVFENDGDPSGSTSIRKSEFDGDGVLQNWPIGFFEY